MQTLNWYYQRLKAMSPDEIAWRACSSIRDIADRLLIERRQRPRKPSDFLNSNTSGKKEGFHVCNMSVGYQTNNDAEKQSYDSLIAKAQKIVGHRLSFFDLQDKYLGEPITWNRDHKREKDTPMTFSPALDYRDVNEAGDCKFVWEPNRNHQLVVLGRAYRLSGDILFAEAVACVDCAPPALWQRVGDVVQCTRGRTPRTGEKPGSYLTDNFHVQTQIGRVKPRMRFFCAAAAFCRNGEGGPAPEELRFGEKTLFQPWLRKTSRWV